MQLLNTPRMQTASGWFWCPRCGTRREILADGETKDDSPKLVDRCRKFVVEIVEPCDDDTLLAYWVTYGIRECLGQKDATGPSGEDTDEG